MDSDRTYGHAFEGLEVVTGSVDEILQNHNVQSEFDSWVSSALSGSLLLTVRHVPWNSQRSHFYSSHSLTSSSI